MKKPTTIHDIARAANVSSATVSRVLSNSGYPVSKPMREKILRVAAELNYIPNLIGKQLKKNTSNTIGVIVPTIVNPFYASVVFGIEEIARQNSFTVMACNTLQDPALEEEYIRTVLEKQVKGLIISSISSDKTLLKQAIGLGLHVIAIDQNIEEDGISQIDFDYRKGACLAVKYLLEKGHSRIGYVTSKLDRPSRKLIYQGYLESMREAGLEPLVAEAKAEEGYSAVYEFDTGRKLAQQLLENNSPPTAIFTCNDLMAFGVIQELSRRGVDVPGQISVMGFDGIEVGQMIHPPLTTIKQPDYEMGKMACKMLIDRMNGEESHQFDVILQPKLIERSSVAAREAARSHKVR